MLWNKNEMFYIEGRYSLFFFVMFLFFLGMLVICDFFVFFNFSIYIYLIVREVEVM